MRVGMFLLMVLALCSISFADVSSDGTKSASGTAKSAKGKGSANAVKPAPITAEKEAAALAFVRDHHAELAELLIHLKESSSKEYERAIRDLSRASDRLSQIRERDLEAYELELKVWQARSRAQLLGARLQMADNEEVREKLREALTEEYDLRVQILTREKDRFAEKTKNLEQQIARLTERRDAGIEGQYQQLTKAARKNPTKKSQNKAKTQAKQK